MLKSLVANRKPLEKLKKTWKLQLYSKEDWDNVKILIEKLNLIAAMLRELEATTTPTIHMVFPYLIRLRDSINFNNDTFGEKIATEFSALLRQYFGISTLPETKRALKSFIVASFLDPRTKHFTYVPTNWQNDLKQMCSDEISAMITNLELGEEDSEDDLDDFSALRTLKHGIHLHSGRNEIQRYLDYTAPKESGFELLSWWSKHRSDFPNISLIARNILAVPASSSGAERIFSHTKDLATDKRSRITAKNFQMACFINVNKNVVSFTL